MKNNFRGLLLLLAVSLTLASCSKNTPKEVARAWLVGFNRMEFEQSMKLSTNDTKNLLSSLQELTEGVTDSGKSELKKITVTINDVKEDGDKAVVTYVSSDNPVEQSLNLVKQNDKWLVQFTKTDLVGTMPKNEEEETLPTTDSVVSPPPPAQ
jgi:N-methylhydantoinase B/oxoprolinase/acetone carboxylase alpha subunit